VRPRQQPAAGVHGRGQVRQGRLLRPEYAGLGLGCETLEEITSFGDGGRQPGQFYGVHNVATDSKGNLYTAETWEGKRLQKFVYKGTGQVARGYQGVLWPRKS
jgi:hypothetical protein